MYIFELWLPPHTFICHIFPMLFRIEHSAVIHMSVSICLSIAQAILQHTVWTVNCLPPKKKKHSFCPDCPTPGSFTPFLCLCGPIYVRIHMVMGVRRWGGSHVQCGTRAFVFKLPPPRPEVKLNSAQIPQRVWPWAGPDWTGARGASCDPLWSQAFWVIEDPDY